MKPISIIAKLLHLTIIIRKFFVRFNAQMPAPKSSAFCPVPTI